MTDLDAAGRLTITPVTLAEARAFVRQHHRHHPRSTGHILSLAVADDAGQIRGVAIVGRPKARMLQDGWTAEATRVATDGARNASSCLYAAAWRAARAVGYRRLITYTQAGETGASLRAAGWRVIAQRPPRPGWDMPSRPRIDTHPVGIARTLWEAE